MAGGSIAPGGVDGRPSGRAFPPDMAPPTAIPPGRSMPPQTVEIEAPCDMPEGYSFMAVHEGQPFPVTVPRGGLRRGQAFVAPYGSVADADGAGEGTPFVLNTAVKAAGGVGAWRDGLFDCCRLGAGHPSLLQALCCPQVLMAQVLTRLKMNWLAVRAPDYEWRRTYRTVLGLVAVYWALTILLMPHHERGRSPARTFLYRLVGWVFTGYTLVVLTKLRRAVRIMYDIPVTYRWFGQWEDLCLSFWCGMCAISQIARQTGSYEEQAAACWSATGLRSSPSVDSAAEWLV